MSVIDYLEKIIECDLSEHIDCTTSVEDLLMVIEEEEIIKKTPNEKIEEAYNFLIDLM